MASPAMRLAIIAACADAFYVLIDELHFEPRYVDEFSKRRATLALRQPAIFGTRRYSLPLRIAAIKRGLRRPCITATTHNGFLSGA